MLTRRRNSGRPKSRSQSGAPVERPGVQDAKNFFQSRNPTDIKLAIQLMGQWDQEYVKYTSYETETDSACHDRDTEACRADAVDCELRKQGEDAETCVFKNMELLQDVEASAPLKDQRAGSNVPATSWKYRPAPTDTSTFEL